jgi:hypothetical protein
MKSKWVLTSTRPAKKIDRFARIGSQLKMSPHQGAKRRIGL